MALIVLDMEWNQGFHKKGMAHKDKPLGEIIQIGAVKLGEGYGIADTFSCNIRPRYHTKMHSKVKQLTGIDNRQLQGGIAFEQALEEFLAFCGESPRFLTWGYDDIPMLRENLRFFEKDDAFTQQWCNLQRIFNEQTDGASQQRSLATALEMLGLSPCGRSHDALNDALDTAALCPKLDVEGGFAKQSHVKGAVRDEFFELRSRAWALEQPGIGRPQCPHCGAEMEQLPVVRRARETYTRIVRCPVHGAFTMRLVFAAGQGQLSAKRRLSVADEKTVREHQARVDAQQRPPASQEQAAD